MTHILLTQRDAGEMADSIIYDHGAKGQSVPSDTDGGNKTARRSLSGTREEEAAAGWEECNNLYALWVGTPSH